MWSAFRQGLLAEAWQTVSKTPCVWRSQGIVHACSSLGAVRQMLCVRCHQGSISLFLEAGPYIGWWVPWDSFSVCWREHRWVSSREARAYWDHDHRHDSAWFSIFNASSVYDSYPGPSNWCQWIAPKRDDLVCRLTTTTAGLAWSPTARGHWVLGPQSSVVSISNV